MPGTDRFHRAPCLTLLLVLALAGRVWPLSPDTPGIEVIRTHPHDAGLFTQGLALRDGRLYESSGLRGRSRVLAGAAGQLRPERTYHFPPQYFAEGLTLVGDEVLVLTWQAQTLFAFDRETLLLRRRQSYRGEGWGLTYDGRQLLLSDGSARISRLDPATLEHLGSIEVRDERGAVDKLNELEWDGQRLYANVWQTNRLLAIDPETGRVEAEWDLGPLVPARRRFGTDGVANGIAHDPATGHLWLTGKGWPILYEVRLRPAPLAASDQRR